MPGFFCFYEPISGYNQLPEQTPEHIARYGDRITPIYITAEQFSLFQYPELQYIKELESRHGSIAAAGRQVETSCATAAASGGIACCIATPPCGMWHVLAFSFSVSGAASCCLFAKETFKDKYKPEVQEFDRIASQIMGAGQSYQNSNPAQGFAENIQKMKDEQKICCYYR